MWVIVEPCKTQELGSVWLPSILGFWVGLEVKQGLVYLGFICKLLGWILLHQCGQAGKPAAAGCGLQVIELPEQREALYPLLQDCQLLLSVGKPRVVSMPYSSPAPNYPSPQETQVYPSMGQLQTSKLRNVSGIQLLLTSDLFNSSLLTRKSSAKFLNKGVLFELLFWLNIFLFNDYSSIT